MKKPPAQSRLSAQDLTVILTVSAVSLLTFSILSGAPLMPTVLIILIAGAFLILYGRLLRNTPSEPIADKTAFEPYETALSAQTHLADNIADAVAMVDKNEHVIYANPAAKALLKIDKLGLPLSTYVREPGVRSIIAKTLTGGATDPMTYTLEDPVKRFIRLSASPFILDRDPPRPMALIFFYDITDYIFVDSQRADFLANASHELKTPIASVLGYIETLRGHAKDDPAAQEKFLGIMQSQAERMQRLINDLLSLRRIEQIEHIAPSETANLTLAVRAALDAVQPLANKRGVNITFTAQEAGLVLGHQDELVQLTLNLIDNAVKISDAGSRIDITMDCLPHWAAGQAFAGSSFSEKASSRRIVLPASTDASFYALKLRDYGPGFAREHLPRIGERFYRIAGDLSSKEKGTGLGLAIVKHITRRHRAGLLIQSAPGEGTEFTVLLPAAQTAPDDGPI
ncbi:MAG: ATP-binding protein [Hellea sp.]